MAVVSEETKEEKLTDLVDARGVEIEPGDAVIYSSMVNHPLGRRVVMAEGVVLARPCRDKECEGGYSDCEEAVSLTPSGRVRVRDARRFHGGKEGAIVDVAPDRITVLKQIDGPFQPGTPDPCFALPPSPLR